MKIALLIVLGAKDTTSLTIHNAMENKKVIIYIHYYLDGHPTLVFLQSMVDTFVSLVDDILITGNDSQKHQTNCFKCARRRNCTA